MSDKTPVLYSKNIKRLLDAGLNLKDPNKVIEWINTVQSQRGKNFSPSTKRNIYTAILSEQGYKEYQNEDFFNIYKAEQDILNKMLFKKYRKNGTTNIEKKKKQQEEFTIDDYNKLLRELIKNFDEPVIDTQIIYGIANGEEVIKKTESVLSGDLLKWYNMSKNEKENMVAFILLKMLKLYKIGNDIGRIMIIDKKDFDNKYDTLFDKDLKDENFLLVDNNSFKIIQWDYKNDTTNIIKINDSELIDVLNAFLFDYHNSKSSNDIKKLKWTKKLYNQLIKDGIDMPPYEDIETKDSKNYKYRNPITNSMDRILKDGFIFGEALNSKDISNTIKDIGKKYFNYDDLSPSIIRDLH
jgi:hypothetical protein